MQIDKNRAGVLIGTTMGGLTVFADGVECLIKRGHRKLSPFTAPYMLPNMGPAMLAMDLGFMGPNYAISAACASSNFCFCVAANHIREGKADLMIAGGVEAPFTPFGIASFSACGALSKRNDNYKTACRPWDKYRDGFVMGEGAGVLVNSPSSFSFLFLSLQQSSLHAFNDHWAKHQTFGVHLVLYI